jgi:hypothetical protein
MSKGRLARLVLALLLASALGVASEASSASASVPTKHLATAAESKKRTKKASLAKAAAWVDVATQLNLTPDQPAPEQFTDPSAPQVQQISSLIEGLGFKGVGRQTFSRTQADASDPTRLIGNYIVKVVVFKSAADAKKFRDADSKEVTDRTATSTAYVVTPSLKQVGTYKDGVVLDDTQGHINVMFTIGNVVVDIRTGVTEPAPGDGVKDIKKVAAAVVANSKKR